MPELKAGLQGIFEGERISGEKQPGTAVIQTQPMTSRTGDSND
jgi:hypothetical protein